MATTRSISELQVHLTKHGGMMARRMLTFIHNSFLCLSPLWMWSRRDVWFGLQSINVEARDTRMWSGTRWPLVDCYNVRDRGLFAFPFLHSHLVCTCSKCNLLQFKDAVKICQRSVLWIQSRACWACWIFYAGFFLFLQKDFSLSVDLMPNAVFCFFFFLNLQTLREHLICVRNEYHFMTGHSTPAWDVCVQTEEKHDLRDCFELLRKVWPWNYRNAAYNTNECYLERSCETNIRHLYLLIKKHIRINPLLPPTVQFLQIYSSTSTVILSVQICYFMFVDHCWNLTKACNKVHS